MEAKIRERPILFSGPMVLAILEGRKTMTRRVIKPQPNPPEPITDAYYDREYEMPTGGWAFGNNTGRVWSCPYGQPGDRLWVRETFRETGSAQYCDGKLRGPLLPEQIIYKADDETDIGPWRPSIYMPRWASRISLEITNVHVEHVQDISEEDAWREGCPLEWADPLNWFSSLWDFLNARPKPVYEQKRIVFYVSYPWDDIHETRTYRGRPWVVNGNPLIWVVEFKSVEA